LEKVNRPAHWEQYDPPSHEAHQADGFQRAARAQVTETDRHRRSSSDHAALVTRPRRAKADCRRPRVLSAPGFGAIPTAPTYPLEAFDGKQNPFFAPLGRRSAPCSTPPRAPAPLAAAVGVEPCRHATNRASCLLAPRLLLRMSMSQSSIGTFTVVPRRASSSAVRTSPRTSHLQLPLARPPPPRGPHYRPDAPQTRS
jgi:hypothetical protein